MHGVQAGGHLVVAQVRHGGIQGAQQLVRWSVPACQGPYGGAQLAHDRRRVDAVPHHVPDHEGGPAARQGDGVEPVAADLVIAGRQIAPGEFQSADRGQGGVHQAALEGERGVAFPAVHARVVDVQCRPGDQFVDQQGVLVVEGLSIAGPGDRDRAEHGASRDQRDQARRPDAGAQVLVQPVGGGGFDQRADVPEVEVHGTPGTDELLVRGAGRDLQGHADREEVGRRCRIRERRRDAADHTVRRRGGPVRGHRLLQQLHIGGVGEPGHQDADHLLRRPRQIQGGAHLGNRLRQQRETPSRPLRLQMGPLPLRDVDQ